MSRFTDFDDDEYEEDPNADEMDEFDQLRRRNVRTGSAFDDLEAEDSGRQTAVTSPSATSSSFALGNFSPGQRLVLALLVLLDILAVGFGVMIVAGVI